jgi:hypothetical protein
MTLISFPSPDKKQINIGYFTRVREKNSCSSLPLSREKEGYREEEYQERKELNAEHLFPPLSVQSKGSWALLPQRRVRDSCFFKP